MLRKILVSLAALYAVLHLVTLVGPGIVIMAVANDTNKSLLEQWFAGMDTYWSEAAVRYSMSLGRAKFLWWLHIVGCLGIVLVSIYTLGKDWKYYPVLLLGFSVLLLLQNFVFSIQTSVVFFVLALMLLFFRGKSTTTHGSNV